GSESDGSSPSPPSRKEAPTLMKTTNNQVLEVKSPVKQSKQDKNENLDYDKIVNLIEETGHFHITNTTFDFDLCSLDRSTVRKLQSYLETSGLS
uniref:MLLT3 super elongation complex subunit n=1 Tax=Fundulus heteroclitus TaxID=8078 RepID=A0A3Q2NS32_FUNHE